MMEKFFSVKGDGSVDVFEFDMNSIKKSLLPAVYQLHNGQIRGYYLQKIKDKMEVPSKLYGSAETKTNKVLKKFYSSKSSVGVLFTGIKGAGKSMTMGNVCNNVINDGIPVVLINDGFNGTEFNNFINKLGLCCLVFDEFGKVYSNDDDADCARQSELLTLMDGVFSSKRLILLSENNEHQINQFMLNRPGRIHYHFRYEKLEDEVIVNYSKDNGIDDSVIEEIKNISNLVPDFSFDILKCIIDEHKEYPEQSIEDIIKDLNVDNSRMQTSVLQIVDVIDVTDEKEISLFVHESHISNYRESRNGSFWIECSYNDSKDDKFDICINRDNMLYCDIMGNRLFEFFRNGKKYKVVAKIIKSNREKDFERYFLV